MATTLTGTFETRRAAEMAIERLVQEFGVDRAAITVATAGDDNSAGAVQAGSDTEAGQPSPDDRDDAPLNGGIVVTVDSDDGAAIRDAFAEFGASGVAAT